MSKLRVITNFLRIVFTIFKSELPEARNLGYPRISPYIFLGDSKLPVNSWAVKSPPQGKERARAIVSLRGPKHPAHRGGRADQSQRTEVVRTARKLISTSKMRAKRAFCSKILLRKILDCMFASSGENNSSPHRFSPVTQNYG